VGFLVDVNGTKLVGTYAISSMKKNIENPWTLTKSHGFASYKNVSRNSLKNKPEF